MDTTYSCSMTAGLGFAAGLPTPPPFSDDGISLFAAVYVKFLRKSRPNPHTNPSLFAPILGSLVVPRNTFITNPTAVTLRILSSVGVEIPPRILDAFAQDMSSFAVTAAAGATARNIRILPLCVHLTAVSSYPDQQTAVDFLQPQESVGSNVDLSESTSDHAESSEILSNVGSTESTNDHAESEVVEEEQSTSTNSDENSTTEQTDNDSYVIEDPYSLRALLRWIASAEHADNFSSLLDTVLMDSIARRNPLLYVNDNVDRFRSGVSSATIAALEKVKISTKDDRCAICLEDFSCKDDDDVVQLPCSHLFHRKCVVQWLEKSHVCPLCRFAMPTS